MIFKLENIQIPLTGETDNFDGTIMLNKSELALTNSMIQVIGLSNFVLQIGTPIKNQCGGQKIGCK